MATAEKILEIARSQIGTRESPANSDNVKYNTVYYGREVSGKYPWCAVFVWWVFREAGAPELYYGGGETAYCPTLMSFHKKQAVTDYRPGDIVFFNFSGKSSAGHVGICESWDGTYITTIDGNTGGASEDNGGAVMRRRRHKKYIVGAYRPDYEEEESVTYEQWLEYLERGGRQEGVHAGAVGGGCGAGPDGRQPPPGPYDPGGGRDHGPGSGEGQIKQRSRPNMGGS